MGERFNIIEYISGFAGNFVLDGAVLRNIALERNVLDVDSFDKLDKKTRDLLKADVLYSIYLSPNVWASDTKTHGSYTRIVGSQTIYAEERQKLFDIFSSIYKKYDDDKLDELTISDGTVEWLEM